MKFIGRENEKKKLINTLSKPYSETILIYGRRRVGKSELIKQCLKEIDDTSIYYECKQTTEINNVESLASLISEQFHYPKLAFSNLEALLSFLFEKAIESKVTAEQEALKAKNKTVQIQEEAKQKVISAEAEAKSMAIRANALSQNKALVEYEAVKKWDGKLPDYMMGNSVPFISLKK